jgi:RHS repeat-associated protein
MKNQFIYAHLHGLRGAAWLGTVLCVSATMLAQSGQLAFEPGLITTTAGQFSVKAGYSGDGGPATGAQLTSPSAVTVDAAGNLFIADCGNNVIRKVSASSGVIATVAGTGGVGGYSGDGGPATSAQLSCPHGVAVDLAGNLYIADEANRIIREVTASTGVITTVAGTPRHSGYTGDGGYATNAMLRTPMSVAVDLAGNLYIADYGSYVIRKVTAASRYITTVAGNGTSGYSGDGQQATSAQVQLGNPTGVAVDPAGNIYIADGTDHVIRQVTVATGIISTVAGIGPPTSGGSSGDGGPARGALFMSSWGIAVDAAGNLYIADTSSNNIREVTASTGVIATIAGGSGVQGFGYAGDGGPATSAQLHSPQGVAVDAAGNIYFADSANNAIRKISASAGSIVTVAGSGGMGDAGESASATLATLTPSGVTSDQVGDLYIANGGIGITSPIRKVAANTGTISSVNTNGRGNSSPAMAVDPVGNLYIADISAGRIDEVLAASGAFTQQLPINNWTWRPTGVALDSTDNLYASDGDALQIYKQAASTGAVTIVAGTGVDNADYAGDGGPAVNADIFEPNGIAVDRFGNIYIEDYGPIRVVYSSGITIPNVANPVAGNIYLLAGREEPMPGYSGDGGPAIDAQLGYLRGIAVDPAGDLYITDSAYSVVRKISVAGIITTVAGNGAPGFAGDGGSAASAELSSPIGISFDPTGNLYIADSGNGLVRKISPQGILAFGGQPVGTASASQTISVANRGSSALTFSAAPSVAGDFSIVSGNTCGSSGSSLPSGGSCVLAVTFTPSAGGNRTGSVTLAYNGGASTQILNLTGTGTESSGPLSYDSGTVTLTVNGPTASPSVTVNYGQGSTPTTIAASLVAAFAGVTNAPMAVASNNTGNGVIITATQPGSASDYSYTLTTASSDPTDFGAGGSFSTSQTSGTLAGGTAAATTPATVYQYTITPTGGPSGYAPNGNLVSYTDSVMGSWNFSYDGLNRLIGGAVTPSVNENLFYCWSYDSFGNRTNQSGSNTAFQTAGNGTPPCQPATNGTLTTNIATYNSNNQITSSNALGVGVPPTYDPSGSGNIISDGVNQYLYDGEGRICATAYAPYSGGTVMTQYLYDASGNRVAKGTITSWSCDTSPNSDGNPTNGFTITNQYILGPNGEQMTELALNSGNALAWKHTNIYAGGSLIATYLNDGSGPHFHLNDWLGTHRAQTNFAGSLEQTCQSLPFGDAGPCVGATEQFFTGKERDTESGLDYFGARYYGSSMGRFMSPDPSGLTYADISNPQSLNLYAYTLNNPLKFTDPTGMYCFYGGKGDTTENDGDVTDYDFTDEQGDCHGQWIDNPTTNVTVSTGGDNGNTLSTFPSDVSLNYQFIPGKGCSAALKTAGTNSKAINNYYNLYQTPIGNAGKANGVDPRFLAAVGVRESGLPANPDVVQAGGSGRGLFQIDLGAHPGVTVAQAFDPGYSANYAANLLSTNRATLESQHPYLDPVQLTHATAASYNFGTGNISGNPNTIDAGTTGGNYGSNVIAITLDCLGG